MPKKVRCTYCGSSRCMTDDHIQARKKGGSTTTPACQACNSSKGDKALMEWLRWVKENDPYRWRRIKKHNKNKKNKIAQKVHKIRDKS